MYKVLPIYSRKTVFQLLTTLLTVVIGNTVLGFIASLFVPSSMANSWGTIIAFCAPWGLLLRWQYNRLFKHWFWSFTLDDGQISQQTFTGKVITLKKDSVTKCHHQGLFITLSRHGETLKINTNLFTPKEQILISSALLDWVPRFAWDVATQEKLENLDRHLKEIGSIGSNVDTTTTKTSPGIRLTIRIVSLLPLFFFLPSILKLSEASLIDWVLAGMGLLFAVGGWLITAKTTIETNVTGIHIQRWDYTQAWRWEVIEAVLLNFEQNMITIWANGKPRTISFGFIDKNQKVAMFEAVIRYLFLYRIPFA